MKLIDKAAWEDWKAKNAPGAEDTIGYGIAVFNFAELWADRMEARAPPAGGIESMSDAEFSALAELTEHQTTKGSGLTGFQYGMAVAMLRKCWVHGERLNRWHNAQYGRPDAKGTVNPAVLHIGK